ncbi:hypothetical protein LARI1_G009002 [Lachnellula arida]|uniref:2EXR domain-containing protein n=1 Tax=Lachnellula arida TaxID=1316785 RepID=A0A8T9B2W0_9HELO|nr:hypothetical protein LARI1_G009002 [Lachnellula arida]
MGKLACRIISSDAPARKVSPNPYEPSTDAPCFQGSCMIRAVLGAAAKSPDISRLIVRDGSGTLTPTMSSTFTLFPNLPTELQIKIWRRALPGPRIIQFHYLNGTFSFHGARPPLVLHICRTSREVALSVFEPAFTRDGQQVPIYIDLAHDTLYLAADPEMCKRTAGFFPDFKENVRSLAVEISSEEDLEKAIVDIWPLSLEKAVVDIYSSGLDKLNEIILIVGHEEGVFESKNAERVRFKPETRDSFMWWKGSIEKMQHFKGCTVRVMGAKIV